MRQCSGVLSAARGLNLLFTLLMNKMQVPKKGNRTKGNTLRNFNDYHKTLTLNSGGVRCLIFLSLYFVIKESQQLAVKSLEMLLSA